MLSGSMFSFVLTLLSMVLESVGGQGFRLGFQYGAWGFDFWIRGMRVPPRRRCCPDTAELGPGPRKALRTSIKSHFWKIASTFGNKCPPNGSKNEETAPRPRTGCPHEGPFVVRGLHSGLRVANFASRVPGLAFRVQRLCVGIYPPVKLRALAV